jgi:hypothetical protein
VGFITAPLEYSDAKPQTREPIKPVAEAPIKLQIESPSEARDDHHDRRIPPVDAHQTGGKEPAMAPNTRKLIPRPIHSPGKFRRTIVGEVNHQFQQAETQANVMFEIRYLQPGPNPWRTFRETIRQIEAVNVKISRTT